MKKERCQDTPEEKMTNERILLRAFARLFKKNKIASIPEQIWQAKKEERQLKKLQAKIKGSK